MWPGTALITNGEEKPLKERVPLVAGCRVSPSDGGSDKCEHPSVRAQQMNELPPVSKCRSGSHRIAFISVRWMSINQLLCIFQVHDAVSFFQKSLKGSSSQSWINDGMSATPRVRDQD